MLLVGASEAEKTALVMRMLLEPRLLNHDKLYGVAKSLYQPHYHVSRAGLEINSPKTDTNELTNFEAIIEMVNTDFNDVARVLAELNEHEGTKIEIHSHDDPNEAVDSSDSDKTFRKLMIFQ